MPRSPRPRTCAIRYQQHDSGGAKHARNYGREFVIAMRGDAYGGVSELDTVGMAGGNRHEERQNSQHKHDNSDPG